MTLRLRISKKALKNNWVNKPAEEVIFSNHVYSHFVVCRRNRTNMEQKMRKTLFTITIFLMTQSLAFASQDELNRELKIQELQDQIRKLTGENEELRHKLATAEKNIPDVNLAPTESKQSEKKPDTSPAKKDNNLNFGSGPMAMEDYDKIQEVLQKGDYTTAEQMLKKYISHYSDSDLIVNAKYWLAETYYQRGRYGEAAPQYADAYTSYSAKKSKASSKVASKGPEILFKMAKSLNHLGKRDEAKATIGQLEIEFKNIPSSLRDEVNNLKKDLGK